MSTICIVTALPAESRVFIDALKLRHLEDHGWRLFGTDTTLLLQTGIGKLKAAAATSALLHSRPDISAIVNVGIAGGAYAQGTTLLAHKITDAGSGARWYPHLPPRKVTNIASSDLLTLDAARTDYRNDCLFDMESAGVISAATTYLSTDAIQSIKVVSDNTDFPHESVTPQLATELLKTALPDVVALLNWYLQRNIHHAPRQELDELCHIITSQTHHTSNDKQQLRRILQRYLSLDIDLPDPFKLKEAGNAKTIRKHLNNVLSQAPLIYQSATCTHEVRNRIQSPS